MSENTNEREAFEKWFTDFKAEHEEWRYADSEAINFAAFKAGLAHKRNESEPLSPTETFQLHEIFSSIEECPPIAETDSFIVKRVKEMAQLINSLSEKALKVDEAYENSINVAIASTALTAFQSRECYAMAGFIEKEIRALIKRE